jgi:signal transduction histidine kinase
VQEALDATLPFLGDVAFLDLRAEPKQSHSLRSVVAAVSVPLDDARFALGADAVMHSGLPEVHLDVARDLGEVRVRPRDSVSARAAEHLRFLHELGVAGYLCLPLSARDRVLGALTYLLFDARRPYGPESLTLASDLARRFAVALDNQRLYEIARSERVKHEEVSRAKDVFLATLSHELRTPLNAVLGWIQLIRSGALSADKLSHAVETVDRNARALERLVVDLLDVSRIVAGHLSVELANVDLAAVVNSAVDAAKLAAQAKSIRLIVETPPRSPPILGDAGRLHQIVSNLLTNAIKFTPIEGRIAVKLDSNEAVARIEVTDSGEGIAADFLPHVFDHFRQAHSESTRTAGGLGLGLAIVKHLVELHGGRVLAASGGIGRGSTFTVELPLRDDFAAAESRPARDSSPATGPRHKHLAGVHALVVEDDEDGRELLRTVLNGYGAIVTTVATARAALAAIAERPPDVLISDIGLPDEDGFALIQKVRADGYSRLPAIAVTAYVSQSDVGRAFGAGFQAHLPKPIQPTALGAAVARLVGR